MRSFSSEVVFMQHCVCVCLTEGEHGTRDQAREVKKCNTQQENGLCAGLNMQNVHKERVRDISVQK